MADDLGAYWQVEDTELFTRFGEAFVPRRAEQIEVVCELLACPTTPCSEVLDLGCGDGRLAEAVLRRIPETHVTILDASVEMLELAQVRLATFSDRIRSVHARLEDLDWRCGTMYSSIISSLAIHHLNDSGKKILFRDIVRMLSRGGVFAMADLIDPATSAARRLAASQWDNAVETSSKKLYSDSDLDAMTAFERSQWNHFKLSQPDPVDKPSRVTEHVDWLREAGFVDVDVCWAYAGHAVVAGTRKES